MPGSPIAPPAYWDRFLHDLPNANFAVIGLSGGGKSVTLADIAVQAHLQGCAVTVIDPGEDLVENILAHITRRAADRGPRVFDPVHWFQPGSYDMLPRIDWLRFNPAKPVHPEHLANARRLAAHVQVGQVGELVQLKQGQVDFEQNARLQRVLTDFLTACATSLNPAGLHLPLGLLYALLPAQDQLSAEVYHLIAPQLERQVLHDLERIRGYRREEDRLREIESFINRTRAILGPHGKAMYSESGGPVVDFRAIIRTGGLQLWNLKPSGYFTHDDKRTFGQLAIHANLMTMLTMPRDMRVPFLLMVDEAAELNNEMLLWALGAMRKTGTPCSIWLAGQDLSSFKKKDVFDMRPKLLSQCNLICFNQQWPEDTEILARILYGGELSFKELVHEVERHDGYDWHEVMEYGWSASETENWTSTDAHGQSHAQGIQQAKARQKTRNWTRTQSDATAHGQADMQGNARNRSSSESAHASPIIQGGQLINKVRLGSSGVNTGEQDSQAHTNTQTQMHTEMSGKGGGESETDTESVSEQDAVSNTHTDGRGGGQARSVTVSRKKVPLAHIRREEQRTGQLERSVPDQLEEKRQRLADKSKRQAAVKLHGHKVVEIVTRFVADAFASDAVRERALAWAKREIYSRQDYYFVPDFSPEAEERLLRQFLDAARGGTDRPDREEADDTHDEAERDEREPVEEEEARYL